jgi:hypothetical protein
MRVPRNATLSSLGCGFTLLTALAACLLLVLNGLIVGNVYGSTAEVLPALLREPRWAQTIVFVGPVLLMVVQFWAYDVAVDWLWPTPQRRGQKR